MRVMWWAAVKSEEGEDGNWRTHWPEREDGQMKRETGGNEHMILSVVALQRERVCDGGRGGCLWRMKVINSHTLPSAAVVHWWAGRPAALTVCAARQTRPRSDPDCRPECSGRSSWRLPETHPPHSHLCDHKHTVSIYTLTWDSWNKKNTSR